MNLQLDNAKNSIRAEHRNLWSDNRMWWANCLAIERFWFYAGDDLRVARSRRDALLNSMVESM